MIFAFGGNALIATSFYVVQRTSRARLAGRWSPWFVFWGYQLFIVLAATGYLLGVTQSKEYAEPEWYVDLWLTVVWVVYFLVFVGTLAKRREPHIYVANWFYLAFIVTVAMLHIVNNLAVPVSLLGSKSYVIYSGVQDAMTQWWYGHNAVGFFLTAGFLGMMYYFVPKRAERPIYSYRLSIVHFWSLIFLYIWAGPASSALHRAARLGADARHDLLDHAVDAVLGRHDQRPDDAVGRLGQAQDRSRHPPPRRRRRLLRHVDLRGAADEHQVGQCAVALHRLDHRPRAFRRARLGRLHHLRRGLLPRAVAVAPQRALFAAPGRVAFLDLDARHPALHHRDVGVGHPARPDVARLRLTRLPRIFLRRDRRGDASLLCHQGDRRAAVPRSARCSWPTMCGGPFAAMSRSTRPSSRASPRRRSSAPCRPSRGGRAMDWSKHQVLEKSSILLLIGILIIVAIGGLVEIAPLFWLSSTIEKVKGMRPYTPLELAGRDIYIREGCYLCHSQMIRSLRDEVERYGHYSLAAESMYDHPFQWGSKRTGPDLARVGGKYSDEWHVAHMTDPRAVVPESVMPGYPFLGKRALDYGDIAERLKVLRSRAFPIPTR